MTTTDSQQKFETKLTLKVNDPSAYEEIFCGKFAIKVTHNDSRLVQFVTATALTQS